MNNIRIMFIYLCIMILFIGFGYAVWGEDIEVGSVVKTGDLDVRFVDDDHYPYIYTNSRINPTLTLNEYTQQNIKIILKDMYPGAEVRFRLKGVNVGTIPSSFSFAESEIRGDKELLPYLRYYGGIEIDNNGDGYIDWSFSSSGLLKNMSEDLNKKMKIKRLNYLEPNGAGVFYLNAPKTNTLLNQNERINKYILIKFDENAPNDTQNKRLEYKLNLNFKQYGNIQS